MVKEFFVNLYPVKVSSDLSLKKNHAFKLSSGAATCTFTKGDPVLGILKDAVNGATNEGTASYQANGICRCSIGGNVSEGNYLVVDTDGQLIADDAANQFVVAQALEGGVENDLIGVQLILAPTLTA